MPADYSQTAAALGGVLGRMFAGGQGMDRMKGVVDGAHARDMIADSVFKEARNKAQQEVLDAYNAGDYTKANYYSLYGGNFGNTSYERGADGSVFNKVTGGMNADSPLAKSFLAGAAADIAAKQGQAQQYYAAAGLDNANAQKVYQLTPYEAAQLATNSQQNMSSAALGYANAQKVQQLTPYEAAQLATNSQQNMASAALGNANAQKTQQLLPYEQQQLYGQSQNDLMDSLKKQQEAGNAYADAHPVPTQPWIGKRLGQNLFSGGSIPQSAFDYLSQNNTPQNQAAFREKYGHLL